MDVPASRPGGYGALDFSQEVADSICELISAGWSMRSIGARLEMPSCGVIYEWLKRHKSFADQYARARLEQADMLAEEVLDVARASPRTDMYDRIDNGDVQHRRLLIDTLKWRAGKLHPRVYGDHQRVEHAGAGGGPIQVITGVPEPAPKTIEHRVHGELPPPMFDLLPTEEQQGREEEG